VTPHLEHNNTTVIITDEEMLMSNLNNDFGDWYIDTA